MNQTTEEPQPESPSQEDSAGQPDATVDGEQPAASKDPPAARQPFYRRCPVSSGFSLLLLAAYALSSYPVGFQGITEQAARWGALIPEAVHQGEWWRIYTAALLHANPSHLLANLFGILVFGNMLEPSIGSLRLFALYLVSETAGLLLTLAMMPVVSIGASSIDYGLIGTYIGLILLLRYGQNRPVFWQELRGALFFMLLFIVSNSLELERINLWGHLGGFLGGIVFALILWLDRNRARH
ncbi:MAG TPA: rhomboid family intramembrane serine protease [Coleofasciculaceae cyanobacterium]|jgi:membrane associated rhomboid family serine protease